MATLKVDSVMEEGNGTSYDVVGYIPGKSHDQQIILPDIMICILLVFKMTAVPLEPLCQWLRQ